VVIHIVQLIRIENHGPLFAKRICCTMNSENSHLLIFAPKASIMKA